MKSGRERLKVCPNDRDAGWIGDRVASLPEGAPTSGGYGFVNAQGADDLTPDAVR